MYDEIAAEIIAESHPDWEVIDDCVIVCPHGHSIEYDGRCPEGCVSPFRELGLI